MRILFLALILLVSHQTFAANYSPYSCQYSQLANGDWVLTDGSAKRYFVDLGWNDLHVIRQSASGSEPDKYTSGTCAVLQSVGSDLQFVMNWITGSDLNLGYGGCLYTGNVQTVTQVAPYVGGETHVVFQRPVSSSINQSPEVMVIGMRARIDEAEWCSHIGTIVFESKFSSRKTLTRRIFRTSK